MGHNLCIRIEVLENGYEVELPDVDAIDKAEAAAKKSKGSPMVYMGDCMKKYAAKTVRDVLKLVEPALKNLPQSTYDEAFKEAEADDD